MNSGEAWGIVQEYIGNKNATAEDEFMVEEAMEWLMREGNPEDCDINAYNLASHYEEIGRHKLALKYYQISADMGNSLACAKTGYLYYHGVAGEADYEKAYKYLTKADEKGWKEYKYLIAEMYKCGYFLEKDYGKYEKIIGELYKYSVHRGNTLRTLPEVLMNMVMIWEEKGLLDSSKSENDLASIIIIDASKELLKWAEKEMRERIRTSDFLETPVDDLATLEKIQELCEVLTDK